MEAYKVISEEVKECPFCKGTKILYSVNKANADNAFYGQCYCNNCRAYGPRVRWIEISKGSKRYAAEGNTKYKKEAINLWNKRGITMEKYVKLSDIKEMIDDADRIFQEMEDYTEVGYVASDINLELLPVADVAPVRHAHWKFCGTTWDGIDEFEMYGCSACNATNYKKSKYCPNCGAKMDEE